MTRTRFLIMSVITFIVLLGQCYRMAAAETNILTDQFSLATLKSYIKYDPHNALANWSNSTFVCNWTGVTCGLHNNHLRVEGLHLSFFGLVGTIPPHLGNLSFLVDLVAMNNSFQGILPSKLSRLSQLKYINFGFNELTGQIPSWMGSLPKLVLLFLYGNQFSGSLPIPICNLTSLEIINLNYNQLSGSIPKDIGNMTLLKELYLDSNKIEGIPEEMTSIPLEILEAANNSLKGQIPLFLFNMSSLTVMTLTRNKLYGSNLPDNICQNLPHIQEFYFRDSQLYGPIPSKLWQCKELRMLQLGENYFSGVIPQNIGNLTKIRMLDLGHNKLTGTIPKEIGNLQNLEGLYLQFNSFSGVVPPTIFNMSTIRQISLHYNQFSGGLPSTLGLSVPNLESLSIERNSFSGLIPKSISNASKLTQLDLGHNHFYGFIPNTLSALKNLQWFTLANNNLTIESTTSKAGILSSASFRYLRHLDLTDNPLNVTLPNSIGNLSASLEYVYIKNCNLRGSIPSNIANLSSLITLSLSKNGLSGSIPASIGRLQKLQGLYLYDNKLQGSIPFELCRLQKLVELNLANNMLLGSIPKCFGNLTTSLRFLLLASNNLTFKIPSTFWGLTDILYVDLSSNSLNGFLSEDIGKLKVVTHIDVSNNQLSGNISSSIGDLLSLDYLSLKNNRFEGLIPNSFGNLISIESLDLSMNNLSGEIPKSLEKLLYFKFLNLSSNMLYGEIPSGGPFTNFSSQSFMANYGLCGASRFNVPPCKNASRKAHVLVWRYIIPCVFVIVIMVVLIMIVLLRKRKEKPDSEIVLFPDQEIWRKLSHLELSRATDGFKEDNLIGNGSFGLVYHGILSNGKNVAVKVFNLELEEVFKSFDSECEILCNIRHRNLVKVITCCSNVDFKALVLEYMPGGSLEKWLHFGEEFCLNVLQRLNIMIDVASALDYLHYGYSTPIVHCDLKPSNVLLDEDMIAHVADFGIAKLLCGENSMTQTMTLATVGYMAPEYGLDGIVSRKGDVYSYGVMLMEVFTGKKPTDEMFAGEMNLKQWVENSYPHSVLNIIDANLLRIEDRPYTIEKDCFSSVMELALACSTTLPEERIDMKNILNALNKIKKKFLTNVGGS